MCININLKDFSFSPNPEEEFSFRVIENQF